jgi:hypothetical protein
MKSEPKALLAGSEFLLALVKRLVMLDARDAKTRHSGSVDCPLPAGEFL